MAGHAGVKNVLTIDVEDWFHIPDEGNRFRNENWASLECRVIANTERILSLLEEKNVASTFFFLGWVAEHYPELVQAVHAAGHDIGSHGYNHEPLYRLEPDEFAVDLRRSVAAIQDACDGLRVSGYRPPAFSMTDAVSKWAYPILVREGFTHGSTIFPGWRLYGGYNGPVSQVMEIGTKFGSFTEVPITTIRTPLPRISLCFFGGGYFRITPLPVLLKTVRYLNSRGIPVIFYLHPREFDRDQPRITDLNWFRRWMLYVHLDQGWPKLEALLDNFDFETLSSLVSRAKHEAS